jgi:hypothetical protein
VSRITSAHDRQNYRYSTNTLQFPPENAQQFSSSCKAFACILKMPASKLGRYTNLFHWGFRMTSSILPRNYWDTNSNQAANSSFQILHLQSYIPLYIMCYWKRCRINHKQYNNFLQLFYIARCFMVHNSHRLRIKCAISYALFISLWQLHA